MEKLEHYSDNGVLQQIYIPFHYKNKKSILTIDCVAYNETERLLCFISKKPHLQVLEKYVEENTLSDEITIVKTTLSLARAIEDLHKDFIVLNNVCAKEILIDTRTKDLYLHNFNTAIAWDFSNQIYPQYEKISHL